MKQKTLLFLSLALLLTFGLTSFDIGSPTGAPAGMTGSPGDGNICSSCHGGNASTVSGWITTDIPAEGYTPGQTYQISCTNNLTASGKYGFQCSPQNSAGALLGSLTAGTNNHLVGTKYVTHTAANTTNNVWTFSWTAPAATVGSVTFYAAFVKGTNGTVAKTSLTVTKASGVGINTIADKANVAISPNPNMGRFNVLNLPDKVEAISVLDITGKVVYQLNQAETNAGTFNIDLGKPTAGIYFLDMDVDGKHLTRKFVIR